MSRRRSVARAGAGILVAALALPVCAQETATGGNAVATTPYVIDTRPELLSYDELVALGSSPQAPPDLERKLNALLETPFVNNEAFHRGAEPFRPVEPGLQQVVRVVSWNIERGLQLDLIEALFTDDAEFRRHLAWKREIYKRVGNEEFWAQQGLKIASGLGIAFDAIRNGVNLLRRHSDPTVADVPVLAPNDESEFFEVVENFRFADGGAFDFRGDKTRAVNGAEGTLANSNHREGKGFMTTFQVDRAIGRVSKMKLDWIFVKAFATDPRDEAGSYRFAPHFGRTMEVLNDSIDGRISDHSPITVDLPLATPRGQDDCCGGGAP